MRNGLIWLARIEFSLAILTGAAGIVTLFWRDWIEALTGWSPDGHNGGFELGLIAVLFIASLASAVLGRMTYRRLAASA